MYCRPRLRFRARTKAENFTWLYMGHFLALNLFTLVRIGRISHFVAQKDESVIIVEFDHS